MYPDKTAREVLSSTRFTEENLLSTIHAHEVMQARVTDDLGALSRIQEFWTTPLPEIFLEVVRRLEKSLGRPPEWMEVKNVLMERGLSGQRAISIYRWLKARKKIWQLPDRKLTVESPDPTNI